MKKLPRCKKGYIYLGSHDLTTEHEINSGTLRKAQCLCTNENWAIDYQQDAVAYTERLYHGDSISADDLYGFEKCPKCRTIYWGFKEGGSIADNSKFLMRNIRQREKDNA